jgi:3-phenylpropionate/trans-cinnamate dioxygenase ferredoxin reductase subunit
MEQVLIVGAGQAGVQVADSLRVGGYAGEIALVGDEPDHPYQRPPLSKDYLAPGDEPGPLPVRGERFFQENRIAFHPGAVATSIDRAAGTVTLRDGTVLPYERLVLATGAANRVLSVPGGDLAGIHELRTLGDARKLRTELAAARSAVVIGAGFIGLEFAAAARKRGIEVTVLEASDRPMGRALSPVASAFAARTHRRMGADLRFGEGIAAFTGADGRVTGVVSALGAEYGCDLVLVGIGVNPRTELAEAAGLEVDGGIVVDETLRTSDPAIYAIGDCASFLGPQGRTRLESVQNAVDQARHVAQVLLGATDAYREPPWFWSKQGDLRLQIAGIVRPDDQHVVCGDLAGGRFSVLGFRAGRLAAVESVNRPADHVAARKLFAAGLSPTAEQAADPSFTLKDFATQGSRP